MLAALCEWLDAGAAATIAHEELVQTSEGCRQILTLAVLARAGRGARS
jgi:hypothetical protein